MTSQRTITVQLSDEDVKQAVADFLTKQAPGAYQWTPEDVSLDAELGTVGHGMQEERRPVVKITARKVGA